MPRALPFTLREQIVRLRQAGQTYAQIAASLQVKARSVEHLCKRYRARGEEGLSTDYSQCGPKQIAFDADIQQRALEMRREHPRWGGGLICLQLQELFAKRTLPCVRTLQRWFASAGLTPARRTRPPVERTRGEEPHAVWEVDAKERMRLADGTGTSVLDVTDEASGALVGAEVFPPLLLDAGAREGGSGGDAGDL
jgi:transposase